MTIIFSYYVSSYEVTKAEPEYVDRECVHEFEDSIAKILFCNPATKTNCCNKRDKSMTIESIEDKLCKVTGHVVAENTIFD